MLDASALALAALRVRFKPRAAGGRAEKDARGLKMQIWY